MEICDRFERLLALHCSPAIAGIKPSNLVSCQSKYHNNIPLLVKNYNQLMNSKDIFLDILCEYENYTLVLVYNKNILTKTLESSKAQKFLNLYGYTLNDTLENMISTLTYRIDKVYSFPHEIGLFLGYPIEDVVGFIENKGANYKFYGYWKVYSNEENAKNLFDTYTKCREIFCNKILSGMTLSQLINTTYSII